LVLKTALRDAEEVIKVSSYNLGIPSALTICLSGEPAVSIVNSWWDVLATRKDDGTNFECVWIQSNGVTAHFEIKGCCIREFF
jgi:hypothetical protein